MIYPIINLNGSSAQELAEQYHKACVACEDAIQVMAVTFPHGRDYQTAPRDHYLMARVEHEERIKMLTEVSRQLSLLRGHCYSSASGD